MKNSIWLICLIPAFLLSCGNAGKMQGKSDQPEQAPAGVSVQPSAPGVSDETAPEPIVEKREKLVSAPGAEFSPMKFFVIIGSFKSLDNAKTLVGEMAGQQFFPVILKSESGFFRVSVLATDDESKARNEIYRIKYLYPDHADTWLLIQEI